MRSWLRKRGSYIFCIMCDFCSVLFLVLIFCTIHWRYVTSGSGSGLEDCVVTVKLNQTVAIFLFVSDGPVCFECVFGGVVNTNAVFQIDNLNIDEFNGKMIVDGILVVRDVEDLFNEIKVVRCNNGGDTWNQVFIRYDGILPPLITGNSTVSEGDTLSLDCDSSNSASTPPVYWISDGEIISEVRSLVIINITRDMAGIYTCVATSNNASRTNTSVNIIVLYLRPPLITGITTVSEGDTLSLDCDSSNSASTPPVYWISDGEIISEVRSLVIINITRDMAGIYICVATSDDGNTANTSVNVKVEMRVKPVIVITGPTDGETGTVIVLKCQLSTDETDVISYEWSREDSSLPESGLQDNNGTLVILDPLKNDSGVYICTANGLVGNITLTIVDSTDTENDCMSFLIYFTLLCAIPLSVILTLLVTLLVNKLTKAGKPKKENIDMDTNVAYGTPKDIMLMR